MRWFKFGVLAVVLLLSAYWAAMYYLVKESRSFTVQKEIAYPVDKVYPQFSNLQNFARWNHYFSNSKSISLEFYKPYEGKDASLAFTDGKNDTQGELFVRYANPGKTLKYQLFEGKKSNPTNIDVKFVPVSVERTRIIWMVHTPKKPVFARVQNLWAADSFVDHLDLSMINLRNVLANKVEKDQFLTDIKYDSLIVEDQPQQLILGINVSTSNKKDALVKNVVMNHNKVFNYVTNDMQRREDETGFPVLIANAGSYKEKEVSYFLGIPLSKQVQVGDNSFKYRQLAGTKAYVMYYRGSYANRLRTVQQLQQKAKNDSFRSQEIREIFLEAPQEGRDVLLKISLPVTR